MKRGLALSVALAVLAVLSVASASASPLERRLETVIVPKVEFNEVSVGSVLDYLPQLAKQHSGGKVTLNIVRMFPADYGRDRMVTLELANVPLASVLKYVAQLSGLEMEYQPHAVLFRLPAPATPAAPAPR